MDINIEKYVTEEEIHEAIVDEVKCCVREKLTQPGELDKLIVNAAYSVGREELNKIIPGYKEKLEDRIKLCLTDSRAIDFEIFYRGPYNNDLSVAKDILDKAVKENESLIKDNVVNEIKTHKYSVDIRHKVEDVVGSLIDNLYNFIDIIKTKDEE